MFGISLSYKNSIFLLQLLEMTEVKSDHLYGVKTTMSKTKSAMTVVTSEGGTPGSKNVVVVPSPSTGATGSGDTPPPKRARVSTRASEKQ